MQSLFKIPALLILLAAPAAAQTVLTGIVHDGNGGPLQSGQVYHTTGFTVPSGQTLTMEPGAVLKVDGGNITLFGTFLTSSTTEPAYVTSLFDDVFGGDSNGDGNATSPSPGDWNGFRVLNTGSLLLDEVEMRWGGGNNVAPVRMEGGTLELRDCVIQRALEEGIDLNRATPSSVVTAIDNCAVIQCGTYPVDNASIDDVTAINLLEAIANVTGDYVRVTDGSLAADASITLDNIANLSRGALVLAQRLTIPAGLTLDLEPGVVVKFDSAFATNRAVDVSGTLRVRGDRNDPVVFTSFADDEHGDDTNEDGSSSGAPGDWGGIRSFNGGLVDLEHALVRFGGSSPRVPVESANNGGDLRLRKVIIEHAEFMGMAVGGNAPIPDVQLCTFRDNGTHPIDAIDLAHVQGFLNNTARDNGASDAMRVTRAIMSVPVTIAPDNYPGPVLISATGIRMLNDAPFTAMRGTILKMEAGNIQADGPFHLNGTAFEPVVVTSIFDDSQGGDTNKDGSATQPAPLDWTGITVPADVPEGALENVLVRYGDSVINHSPNVSIRSVRNDFANTDGFQLFELDGDAENLVAFACLDDGLELRGGTFDIVHCTFVDNVDYGVIQILPHAGDVINSISWGNTSMTGPDADYFMQIGNEVRFSNGDDAAPLNNNLDVDPEFVDRANGDLNLQAGSPCIDTAHRPTAVAVEKDHEEFSRLLDPTLSGNLQADMGAYEHHRWRMKVKGRPHIGSALILEVEGPAPGFSYFRLGFSDVTTLIDPWGFRMVGVPASMVGLGTDDVNTPHLVRIPFQVSLVGLEFGIQTLTLDPTSAFRGEWTNLYRACILPKRPGRPILYAPPGELTPVSRELR